jgi:hypothetical protein
MKKFAFILIAQMLLNCSSLFGAAKKIEVVPPIDSFQINEAPTQTLKRGTLVTLSTVGIIKSKEVNIGDIIEMNVHLDIKVNNDVVLGTDHFATARVKKVRRARKFGRGAMIELEALTVRTIDGQLVRLEGGKILKRGAERRTLAWAASIIPTAICLAINPPVAPLFIGFGLFMKGREIEIPEGTLMTAKIMQDTKVRS